MGAIGPIDFLFQEGQRFDNVVPDSEKQNGAVATELFHDGSCIRFRDFILRFRTRG